jgi:hypothetical protein
MQMKYNVQIKVDGEWGWAGIDPMVAPFDTYRKASYAMQRMSREPYWISRSTAMRVRAIPGTGEAPKGPRAIAREAIAWAEAAEERCERLIAERDQARKTVEELAGKLGLEVEW